MQLLYLIIACQLKQFGLQLDGTGNCELDDSPSICFGFKIPHDLMSEDISVAKLWIYKQRNILIDGDNELVRHTLVYYEIKLGILIELKTQVTQIDGKMNIRRGKLLVL